MLPAPRSGAEYLTGTLVHAAIILAVYSAMRLTGMGTLLSFIYFPLVIALPGTLTIMQGEASKGLRSILELVCCLAFSVYMFALGKEYTRDLSLAIVYMVFLGVPALLYSLIGIMRFLMRLVRYMMMERGGRP